MRGRGDQLESYEGLVRCTAQLYYRSCGLEPEDLEQLIRLKIWQVIPKFDATRTQISQQEWVFGCVRNRIKDIIRDRVRADNRRGGLDPLLMAEGNDGELLIGTVTMYRERFEERYLASSHEEVFGTIEDGRFTLPATITAIEAKVIVLLMKGHTQKEISERLRMRRQVVKRHQDSIETKLSDWKPDGDAPVPETALQAA